MRIGVMGAAQQQQRSDGAGGPGRPPAGGPGKLADALGMSVDELRAARDSGRSLAEFASSKGISRDDLLAAVKTTMRQGAQRAGAPALSDDKLTEMANRMIDRVPGRDGHHGVRGAGGGERMPPRELLDALKTAGGDYGAVRQIISAMRDRDGDDDSSTSAAVDTRA